MGSSPSIPNTVDLDDIINSTGLTKRQINALWIRFDELDVVDARNETKVSKGYLDYDDLRRVQKFDENPIARRLIKVIFDDFATDGKLYFKQFVKFMSTFTQRESNLHNTNKQKSEVQPENTRYSMYDSTKDRKIKFIFRMYDIDRDGKLSKQDVQETLKMMVGQISDEEASIIAEKVISEFATLGGDPEATVDLPAFENALQILDFNDKMSLKLLK